MFLKSFRGGKNKQNENLEEIRVKEIMLGGIFFFFFARHSTGMRLHQRSKAILSPDNLRERLWGELLAFSAEGSMLYLGHLSNGCPFFQSVHGLSPGFHPQTRNTG